MPSDQHKPPSPHCRPGLHDGLKQKLLTIAISNYNGEKVLSTTLPHVSRLASNETDILLIDDGSSDGSPDWVRRNYPNIKVVEMGTNTRRKNALCNKAFEEAQTPYVLLIDNDIILDKNCIDTLFQVIRSRPDILCCTPRLLFYQDPSKIYMDGSGLHFLCIATASIRGAPVANHPPGSPRPTVGCGIMLVDKQNAAQIGFFDANYFIGFSDGEFHYRGRIYGFKVLHVPSAVGLHIARPHDSKRAFSQFYNRYRYLFCLYSTKSLLILAPALLIFELLLTIMSLINGLFSLRVEAVRQVFRDRRDIISRRQTIQRHRRVRDGEILEGGPLQFAGSVGKSSLITLATKVVTPFFSVYWALVRRWL